MRYNTLMKIKTLLTIAAAVTFSACSANASSVLLDINGNALPATPVVNYNVDGAPTSISAAGITAHLYAFGQGPAPITNFGSIKRECDRINPNNTSCYSTSPYEITLTEDSICGYPVVPSVVMSCKNGSCVSELYMQACSTSYPSSVASATYAAPKSSKNISGTVNENVDFSTQSFSSSYDFTANMNAAARIVAQGRTPIIALAGLLFDDNGNMRSDAQSNLNAVVARYPSVFYAPKVSIEIFDEFLLYVPPSDYARRVAEFNKVSALLRTTVPSLGQGVVLAPIWNTHPGFLQAVAGIMPNLNWVATDPYLSTLGNEASPIASANEFINYMRAYYPQHAAWLIVQGFGPVGSIPPAQWGSTEIAQFTNFLSGMSTQGARYDGVLIWGWVSVYELSDAFAGKNFPQAIKNLYIGATQ